MFGAESRSRPAALERDAEPMGHADRADVARENLVVADAQRLPLVLTIAPLPERQPVPVRHEVQPVSAMDAIAGS